MTRILMHSPYAMEIKVVPVRESKYPYFLWKLSNGNQP